MIQINPTNNQPIFEQIVSQIKANVVKGYLKPGDALPSVRKLALQLSVTPGTVAKAYSELEHQEVIVTIRGKGAYIAEKGVGHRSQIQVERELSSLREVCMQLIYMGVTQEEMIEEIKKVYTSVGQ